MKVFKIISIFFVVFGFLLILREYILSKPYSLDAVSMQFSSEVAEQGRADIIKKIQKVVSADFAKKSLEADLVYLKFRDLDSIPLDALDLGSQRDRIICKIIEYKLRKPKNLPACIVLLSIMNYKTAWYVKASYLIGIYSKNDTHTKRAIATFKALPVSIFNADIILDISEIAFKNEKYEDFIMFTERAPYSFRKSIVYYLSFCSPECIRLIKRELDNKTLTSQGTAFFSRVLDCERFIKNAHKRFYLRMWRSSVDSYYGSTDWKMIEYNYPMLTYVTKISGLEDLSNEYLEKSLSSATFERVKPNYVNYVTYAQIALSEAGYNEQALNLIERVHNPIQRIKIFKYTIKHMAKDSNIADKLCSELLYLYKINTFDINYFR